MARGTKPADALYQPLTDDGGPTGVHAAIGDYSVLPISFYFQNMTRAARLTRIIVSIEDVGSLDSGAYGNNITLTNGIEVVVTDANDNVLLNLLPEGPIKTNADWAKKCHDLTPHSFGLGNEVATIRWTFTRDNDGLLLGAGEKLKVMLSDNFSGLVDHHFDIRGEYV